MGRIIRCHDQYEAARREDQFFPVRVRAGILRVSDRPGSGFGGAAKDLLDKLHLPEADNRSAGPRVVGNGYNPLDSGSISFMNVIIEPEKNIIAIYPIFLFYMFIDWFLIFI